MPKLTVTTNELTREVPCTPGASVRAVLDAAAIWVRSGCRANGACGLCVVEIQSGNVPAPTKNERLLLSAEQLQRNTRLACQLIPDGDLHIRIIYVGGPADWRDLDARLLACTPARMPPSAAAQAAAAACGVAVDLGTTHISLSLWDLKRGDRLGGRVGPNPQSYYGSDVVTRLIAAGESGENAARMARITLDAIRAALLDMCARYGVSPAAVGRIAIVGNTPMLALLTETDGRTLLQPSSWTRPIECRPDRGQSWGSLLGIHPQATAEVVPPCGGFIGSDLLAGVLATRLTAQRGGLLVDFGTNSEMALWDGDRLWVTSAAGGPAFDGYHVRCGMPAEPGAIYRVDPSDDAGHFRYAVIGGGEARGICGSGLVDLIACLRSTGKLTATGRFVANGEPGFVIRRENPTLRLSPADVDMFQRAKGAIGAGIKTLLAAANLRAAEVGPIYVGGAFGQHLNCRHAQAVGLLPGVRPEEVELCGNTALAGCEQLLLSPVVREKGDSPRPTFAEMGTAPFFPAGAPELASLRQKTTVINLAESADFERLFLESLYLEPIRRVKQP